MFMEHLVFLQPPTILKGKVLGLGISLGLAVIRPNVYKSNECLYLNLYEEPGYHCTDYTRASSSAMLFVQSSTLHQTSYSTHLFSYLHVYPSDFLQNKTSITH